MIVKYKFIILAIIIFIAGFLRFYQIASNPPSLTWDEVAWGYNAYSLNVDAKDEFGRFLPYDYFESFGDFKPPVYAYLTVPPVIFFGLNEFAVRFPSALFGMLTVLVTYFLVLEIFGQRGTTHQQKRNTHEILALLSALFLAISPWHIMLSRAAFEMNVATFFIITGVWLFLLAVRKNLWLLLLSVVCFVVSLYTFNSTRVVAPLLFLLLFIGHYKILWQHKKQTVAAGIIGLLILLPTIPFLLSPQAKLRYAEVNIFSDVGIVENANQEIANNNGTVWGNVINNRRVAYVREFLTHYVDHFNPQFLFIRGDVNPKFSTQDVGQLFLWQLPFIVVGTLFLFRRREGKWWIIPLWLLIGIIPAAVARETPHALRTEAILPTWQILTAYGVIIVLTAVTRYRMVLGGVIGVVIFGSLIYFLHGYYVHYPREYSMSWQYSYKEVVQYVNSQKDNYDNVYISQMLERPYVYTLFYTQYDPRQFRSEAKITRDTFGFVHVDQFNKFHFVDNPALIEAKGKNLMVAGANQAPTGANVLKTFYTLDGRETFVVYTQ